MSFRDISISCYSRYNDYFIGYSGWFGNYRYGVFWGWLSLYHSFIIKLFEGEVDVALVYFNQLTEAIISRMEDISLLHFKQGRIERKSSPPPYTGLL